MMANSALILSGSVIARTTPIVCNLPFPISLTATKGPEVGKAQRLPTNVEFSKDPIRRKALRFSDLRAISCEQSTSIRVLVLHAAGSHERKNVVVGSVDRNVLCHGIGGGGKAETRRLQSLFPI